MDDKNYLVDIVILIEVLKFSTKRFTKTKKLPFLEKI